MPALGVRPALTNEEAPDVVLDGSFGKYISDQLPGFGLVNFRLLGEWFPQPDQLEARCREGGGADRPQGPRDAEHIFLDSFKSMGANATPISSARFSLL